MNKRWLYRGMCAVLLVGGAFAHVSGPTHGLSAWVGLLVLLTGCFLSSVPQLRATPQPHRRRLVFAAGCIFVLAVSSVFLPNIFLWPCWGVMFILLLYIWWVQRMTHPRVKLEEA